jgi:hypothetical protein
MCPLEGSLALLAASPARDKTLLEYSGGLHTLWAEPVACPITNLGEAEAEVLHLREALLRSEAELDMERELRRSVEEDHEIEMQLRYGVEGQLDEQMALTAESQYRADNLSELWLGPRMADIRRELEVARASWLGIQRELHVARTSEAEWRLTANVLTDGSADLALEVLLSDELAHRLPIRRRGRIRRWIAEGYRDMLLDRIRSRQGSPAL